MQVNSLHPIFAAELVGADLSEAPDEALIGLVEDAMAQYGVLVIRDAEIDDEQQKIFSRAFGPLEIPSRAKDAPPRPQGKRVFTPGIFYAANIDHNDNIIPYGSEAAKLAKGAERFHTDSSFHAMPTKWSLLHGVETPPPSAGGDTWFADARAAYDDLPQALKDRIKDLVGLHDFWVGRQIAGLKGEVTPEQRRQVPFSMVEHNLVRVMPNGRKALFIGGHCIGIKGMGEQEGLRLVEELYAYATQEKYIYRHRWKRWDLVIWDNRCTMHAATPLLTNDYRRDMRRTTINESGPEVSALEWMEEQGLLPA